MSSEIIPHGKIAITGGRGLIGSALRKHLEGAGHEVKVISRTDSKESVRWSPSENEFDASPLEGFDAVVHLAGEPIAQRWTGEVRDRIYSSRVRSTRLLVGELSKLRNPPKVLLSASGINYYPSTLLGAGLSESSEAGNDFLSRVCRHWEDEALKARSFMPRACLLRTSVVLTPEGGALAKLLPVFKTGVGGRIGSGKQPFPWISLDDYVGICMHLLFHSTYSGPANVVAPGVVSNGEFVKTLADLLSRPAIFPVPRTVLRLVFGEMGTSTLAEGVDASPTALLKDGFVFRHPNLRPALAEMLGKN